MPYTSPNPVPCPGCGRDRRTCWVLPCLHLEQVKARGVRAITAWVKLAFPASERASVRVEVVS